jgi:TIGR03009 family protein
MRFSLTLPALLLLPIIAAAQQPANKQAQMLKWTLQNWELAMTRLDAFAVSCRRTTTDKTFGGVDTYEGSAKFLKGAQGQPSRAILEMVNKKDRNKFEKFLYTGTFLYEWVPATKVIRAHDVPPTKPGQALGDDNIVALLFGMTAAAAQQRYQMTWVPDTKDNNKYYHYLQILPRTAADKADFTEARLVLTAPDFLPRQVWYHQPNGNEVTWDFETLRKNADSRVSAALFTPPNPPTGWTLQRVPPQGTVPARGVVPNKK